MFWNSVAIMIFWNLLRLTVNMKCFEITEEKTEEKNEEINRKHEMFWN